MIIINVINDKNILVHDILVIRQTYVIVIPAGELSYIVKFDHIYPVHLLGFEHTAHRERKKTKDNFLKK